MYRLFSTSNSWALTAARLALGVVMLPHGLQKALGWFGGPGFDGAMGFLTGMGIPGVVAVTVILAESLFAVLLIAGALSRVSALLLAAVMIGAVATLHGQHGFFMNWYGAAAGEGFEYHLLALGLATVTMIGGGGALSVDAVVADRLANQPVLANASRATRST